MSQGYNSFQTQDSDPVGWNRKLFDDKIPLKVPKRAECLQVGITYFNAQP